MQEQSPSLPPLVPCIGVHLVTPCHQCCAVNFGQNNIVVDNDVSFLPRTFTIYIILQ